MTEPVNLPLPAGWSSAGRAQFLLKAKTLSNGPGRNEEINRKDAVNDEVSLLAATYVLADLATQGWTIRVDDRPPSERLLAYPPAQEHDPFQEKQRIRTQELVKRAEQLATPSVRAFVNRMERPREFGGRFVSIFNLMRDGSELAQELRSIANAPNSASTRLREVIDPYVQVVSSTERCRHTGLRLVDIWRYFRHTWSNQYTSTPGRTLMLLIRDRAAESHPVIGIAALGSPIVQIRERDQWIGWEPTTFLARLTEAPTEQMALWIVDQLKQSLAELYLEDLVRDELFWPTLWDKPTKAAISRLTEESVARRERHHRFESNRKLKKEIQKPDSDNWRERAESDLFRSKRCLTLAKLLQCRLDMAPYLAPNPTIAGLRSALEDPAARRAIATILRRARASAVGTEMADLTVCGAVAPYNSLLGGKLIAMLAIGPTSVRAYQNRYSGYSSQIASSLAGRSICRRNNLVFVGTTSLYGSGSSQYSRLKLPPRHLGNDADIGFVRLGMSRSFGTSHFSAETVSCLVRLAEQSAYGIRVNSIFGEGVNPKLRKVRHGLDLLGWPSDQLLQHGRKRIVYGVDLVENLLEYLLELEQEPKYRFDIRSQDDVDRISDWWRSRWLTMRIGSSKVLNEVASNRTERPVKHGARVPIGHAQ